MKHISLVVPRFHKDIVDGAETSARLLSQHLCRYYKITVLTTQATNHQSWANAVNKKDELWQNIHIRRFPVSQSRNFYRFNQLSHHLYQKRAGDPKLEKEWMKQHGPYSPELLKHIATEGKNYDLFIFIGYLNALTYFSLHLVKKKAILIPLLHKEPALRFETLDHLFTLPAAIVCLSRGEKEVLTKRFDQPSPVLISGFNADLLKKKESRSQPKIKTPYLIFIGRIEHAKGVNLLFEYFIRFKQQHNRNLNLVLVGKKIDMIPARDDIRYMGVVSNEDKLNLIKHSEFLINSSFNESLSLAVIEAWSLKKPVLVNGHCEALKYQVTDSFGGLSYKTYQEFEKAMLWLLDHKKEADLIGSMGWTFLNKNYSWSKIEKTFKIIINGLTEN